MNKEIAQAFVDLSNATNESQKAMDERLNSRVDNTDERVENTEIAAEENAENIEMNEEALNFVTETVLPVQNEKTEEIEATIDYILTDIIPSLLMGDE